MKWSRGENMGGFSMRTKLFLMLNMAVVLALLLVSTALLVNEKWSAEKHLVRDVRGIADLVGESSGAAMAFEERPAAGENLASLAAIPEIAVAVLYDKRGRVFSTYSRNGESPEEYIARIRKLYPDTEEILKELYEKKEIIYRSGRRLHLLRPVIEKGRRVGAIHLVDNMRQVEERLRSYCIVVCFVVAVTLGILLLLSTGMQKVVTVPLFDLMHSMTELTLKKNYALRVVKNRCDEFGTLSDRFNDMLGEIQIRDDELKAYRSDFEERVEQRTADLERVKNELKIVVRHLQRDKESAEEASRAKSHIVDNSRTNREILRRQTDSWGMENDTAASGAEGINKLIAAHNLMKPFDLVILDMNMSVMDGLQAAERIKAHADICDTRIIMLTSAGFRGDAKKAREAGALVFLTKPVRQSDLHASLLTVMGYGPEDGRRSLVTQHSIAEEMRNFGISVLAVEDNSTNQLVIMAMLVKCGCKVTVASNGREAVDLLSERSFDLVLMDCQMPILDGYLATAAIRRMEKEEPHRRRTPIVALTANALEGDREKCLASGMDDYLSKPYKQEEIWRTLEHWSQRVSHGEKESPGEKDPPVDSPDSGLPGEKMQERMVSGTLDEKASGGEVSGSSAEKTDRVKECRISDEVEADGAGLWTQAEHGADPSPIDRKMLRVLEDLQTEGAPDVLKRVVGAFLADSESIVSSLGEAVTAGDREILKRASHSLKSSSANVGAMVLSEMSKTLEKHCFATIPADAPELVAGIETEFYRVKEALEKEMGAG